MKQKISAGILGGDSLSLEVEIAEGQIKSSQWNVVGRLALYKAVELFQKTMGTSIEQMSIPQGQEPQDLLLRELILKLKKQWPESPSDPELCHCRKISQEIVERAVILGAHTTEKIRQRTTANTGCGTCLPEIEEILLRYAAGTSTARQRGP